RPRRIWRGEFSKERRCRYCLSKKRSRKGSSCRLMKDSGLSLISPRWSARQKTAKKALARLPKSAHRCGKGNKQRFSGFGFRVRTPSPLGEGKGEGANRLPL